MRYFFALCGLLLFGAVADFPSGYYTLLRVVVCVGGVLAFLAILSEQSKISLWAIAFLVIAVLFNPLFPIYLYKRSVWMPLDIVSGILFLVQAYRYRNR